MDGSAPSSNKKSETPSQQRSALRNLKASFNEEATPSGKAHDSDKENHDSNPHSRPQIIFELGVSGTTKTLLTYTHDGKSKTLKLGLVKGGTDQPNIPIKRRTAADHDVETSAGYFEVGNLSDGSAVLTYTPTQAGSLLIPVEGDTRELEENKPTRTHGYESIAFPKITESDDEEEPAAPVSVAVEALSAVAAESRGRLATALLALLNSASETELRDVLAGIGAVRARLIVETRSERLFESLDDAFGRIGLSAKQASNLTLANLRQILASRPTTSPRKRDGARARRSYRKSGRVLARKEGDDPKREYPATIVKVHDCGTVYDIKYDDGTTWKNAPAEVVRLR